MRRVLYKSFIVCSCGSAWPEPPNYGNNKRFTFCRRCGAVELDLHIFGVENISTAKWYKPWTWLKPKWVESGKVTFEEAIYQSGVFDQEEEES